MIREVIVSEHKLFREGYPPDPEPDLTSHTHPGDFNIELNSASLEELSRIPMIGPERARAIIAARPFTRWEQIRHLPDFDSRIVDDLKKGGARIRKAA